MILDTILVYHIGENQGCDLLCHVAVQNGTSSLTILHSFGGTCYFCLLYEKKAVYFPKTVGIAYQSAWCCNVYDLKHSHHTCGLK